MPQDNIPGELKSNYIDLHETTGESYESIAKRLEDNGAAESLVEWVAKQRDTHARGLGDGAVLKAEAAQQERIAAAAKQAEEAVATAPAAGNTSKEVAALRDELDKLRSELADVRTSSEAEAHRKAAELRGASTTDAKNPPASATGTPGKRTAQGS